MLSAGKKTRTRTRTKAEEPCVEFGCMFLSSSQTLQKLMREINRPSAKEEEVMSAMCSSVCASTTSTHAPFWVSLPVCLLFSQVELSSRNRWTPSTTEPRTGSWSLSRRRRSGCWCSRVSQSQWSGRSLHYGQTWRKWWTIIPIISKQEGRKTKIQTLTVGKQGGSCRRSWRWGCRWTAGVYWCPHLSNCRRRSSAGPDLHLKGKEYEITL